MILAIRRKCERVARKMQRMPVENTQKTGANKGPNKQTKTRLYSVFVQVLSGLAALNCFATAPVFPPKSFS